MSAATTPPLHVLRGILRLMKSTHSKSITPAPLPSSTAAPPVAVATNTAAAAAVDQSTSESSSSSSLHAHILSQYRRSQFLLPPQARQQRQIAYEYYILKQDLVERARLHKLDMGSDEKLTPRELTRRSAARAGLQLPEEVE